ncbi:hypothetical protein TrVE_jg5395 [Triparma verrucosa]|nr:hypothetical protein TrVE_jg5395 [Triparma verrucosa]
MSMLRANGLSRLVPYLPPSFVPASVKAPTLRLPLCNLPTPVHCVASPLQSSSDNLHFNAPEKERQEDNYREYYFYLKRDDSTGGVELGGNKLRKLEFLIAKALTSDPPADTLVTIGGIQSNHCRATACAGRMVGLDTSVILRCCDPEAEHFASGGNGSEGNLMYLRASGANVNTVTKEEYGKYGSEKLLDVVCEELKSQGKIPYKIPVGGSNAVGSWGYVEAAAEFRKQVEADESLKNIKHVVFTTGSGGTAAGLSIGLVLAWEERGEEAPKLWAVGVCDTPDYFYAFQSGIIADMGFFGGDRVKAEEWLRGKLNIIQGRGRGYAVTTDDEVKFVTDYNKKSGIFLDPVYTGKSMYAFCKGVEKGEVVLGENEGVMFWHTGGGLGGFAEAERIGAGFEPIKRLALD